MDGGRRCTGEAKILTAVSYCTAVIGQATSHPSHELFQQLWYTKPALKFRLSLSQFSALFFVMKHWANERLEGILEDEGADILTCHVGLHLQDCPGFGNISTVAGQVRTQFHRLH